MKTKLSPRLGLAILLGVGLNCALSGWAQDSSLPYSFQKNVPIPMRDGTQLVANIFLPKTGGPFPIILMRTPYGKPGEKFGEAKRYAEAGFALVAQDCRGRGDSPGLWDPFRFDPEDGFDTQEWVGHQPWCNGRLGTMGGSYVGWTQWASAPKGSAFLKTMVPMVPFNNVYRDIAYPGGAFQLSLLFGWGAAVGGVTIDPKKLDEAFQYLPLNHWDDQFKKEVFYLRDWVNHNTYDDYWKQRGIDGHFADVTVPVLNIGGWYDIFSKTTLDMIRQVRHQSKNHWARRNQFAVIGPWGHGPDSTHLGELDFGDAARLHVGDLQFKWYQYWLQDAETGVQDWPAYYLFVMGENKWRGEHQWPLARTEFTSFYLHGQGQANTRRGGGLLNQDKPGAEKIDTFTYDASHPVPTRGGNNLVGPPAGPFDQGSAEDRSDVLVYSTPPLDHPVEVTGPVKMILYAASSAPDTDFTAKLVDVHPDGKAYNLCDGIIRARYRESFTDPQPIQPGKIYRYDIDLWVTSNLFQTGHRLRVEVSSSNFPRFDRNPNSGKPFGTDTDLLTASQTIFHDAEHPSHLVLPLIPRGETAAGK
jgi:uncharacterized protein